MTTCFSFEIWLQTDCLRTIYPNPGPSCRKGMRRGRSEQQRVERKRYEKRRTRKLGIRKNKLKQITAGNLQGLSLKQNNSNRLIRVLKSWKRRDAILRWEVLLSPEIKGEREMAPYGWEKVEMRQWWSTLGERPSSWEEKHWGLGKAIDQKWEHTERTTAVTVVEMRVTALYQPVWNAAELQ